MDHRIKRLEELFVEIRLILVNEGDINWIRGIDLILEKINLSNVPPSEKLNEINRTFCSMYSGNGSFSDFMIWRDNFQERKKANQNFEALLDEAWNILQN